MEIVTHEKPHLDEVCATWLVRNFWPGGADVAVSYVRNSYTEPDIDGQPQRLVIGVGRGKYDEHRGVTGECAATLIWNELKSKAAIDELGTTAVESILAYVLADDLGKHRGQTDYAFTMPALLEGAYLASGKSSAAMMDLGWRLMDALYAEQRQAAMLARDWEHRIEVPSRFGKTAAVTTDAPAVDDLAYSQGYDLVLIINRAGTYRGFRSRAGAPIDLTPVYEAMATADPGANWFFHHSKHLILLGGDHQPDAKPSCLTLEDMIELVK
jgi:hypothetical protein